MWMGQKRLGKYWDKENRKTSNKPDYLHYVLLKKMIDDLGDIKGKKILDIGCGFGDLMIDLKKRGADVYGIDISKESVKEAKKRGLNIKFGDCREIPFENNTFDIVYSIGVVEHVKETKRSIQEHLRVCKELGNVIIIVPNRKTPYFILGYIYYILSRNFKYGLLATKGKSYTFDSIVYQFGKCPGLIRISNFYGSAFLKEVSKNLNKRLADRIERSFLGKLWGHLIYVRCTKRIQWQR